MKQRLYEILQVAAPDDRASRLFDLFIVGLIVLNVAVVVLETVSSLHARFENWFAGFELLTIGVFTIEYLLRLWVCTLDRRYAHPVWGRLRFAFTPLALVDVLAILPFWLSLAQVDASVIRLVRVMRIFRIAKLARYSVALQTLGRVFAKKRDELLVTLVLMLVLLFIASAFMFYAEHDAQPEAFSSIPAAMWWAVATLTTVGYGDIYPVTTFGKFMGAIIAVLGIGMFALPTGMLGAAFMEEIDQNEPDRNTCPHCGRSLELSEDRNIAPQRSLDHPVMARDTGENCG